MPKLSWLLWLQETEHSHRVSSVPCYEAQIPRIQAAGLTTMKLSFCALQGQSHQPLRRSKRRWVLTTLELEEEDPGPFPKLVGEVYFDAVDRSTGEVVDESLIFNIRIRDVNDHAPQFAEKEFNITVKESQASAAWRTQFHILGGNEEEHFDIMTDPETNQGVLNVIKPLDYETQAAHSLIIVVENQEQLFSCEEGQPQPSTKAMASATVSIHVVDTNDPPAFHPRSFIVSEEDGARPGIRLGAFNATDPDRVASQIRYLEVCESARDKPLLLEAEDSDLHPYSDPFTFDLDSAQRDVEDTWMLRTKQGGRSAELLMLRSLPPGDYLVPLFIADRQGLTQKQTVHVRVCSCPSGSECENRSDVRLLWWALSPVCAALAVLAAALLCLLRCHFAFGPKRLRGSIPSENGHQTLIVYNEESKALSAQKLHAVDVLDSDTGYQPHVYREEGEYEGAETLSSLTVLEQDLSPELPDCLT
ncbi:Cadherin-like protein 26 [Cricetulus griseus]|uniref:Cadherin-like protein 26 n=1 Tax=Cricetulus griseus TaxID=10029 RepID=G3GWS4_CRIGR|nr:Cadherin-like protein 26 [Cricetulus griseus]